MFKKTTYKQIVSCAVGLGALAAVSLVNAATVSLTPSPQTLSVGDTFSITASGTGFDTDVSVLDMTLTWDTTFLTLITSDMTILDDALALGFDSGFPTDINSLTPGVLNLTFAAPFLSSVVTTPSGIFDFFTLEFEAISPTMGSVLLQAFDGVAGGWGDGLDEALNVNYVNADITINNPVSSVPVPAAVWLFGSGLLGLVGIARRSTTTAVTA